MHRVGSAELPPAGLGDRKGRAGPTHHLLDERVRVALPQRRDGDVREVRGALGRRRAGLDRSLERGDRCRTLEFALPVRGLS